MNLFGLGAPEILLILVILLIFFGKDKLPDFANSLGRSVKELKTGFEDGVKPESPKTPDVSAHETVTPEVVKKNGHA